MGERNYEEMFRTTILCMVFAGFLAGLSGLLVVSGYGDHISQLSSRSGAVTSLINKMILVSSESLGSFIFGCFGILMLLFVNKPGFLKQLSVAVLILKLIFECLIFIYYWNAWYYILDPNGSHTSVYYVILFSLSQLIVMFILIYSFKGITEQS